MAAHSSAGETQSFADSFVAERSFQPRVDFGQHFLRSAHRAEELVDRLNEWSPSQVLEVGAGLGTLSEAILRRGYRLWAIEKDMRTAEILEACRARHGGRMRLSMSDVRDVPVDDELSHDAVMLSILPFDTALAVSILNDLFGRVTQLRRAVVVMPVAALELMSLRPGLVCSQTRRFGSDEFVPASAVDLCVSTLLRGER